jgi:hypothetical protein
VDLFYTSFSATVSPQSPAGNCDVLDIAVRLSDVVACDVLDAAHLAVVFQRLDPVTPGIFRALLKNSQIVKSFKALPLN